jgi:succinate dehydrogenase / fumarate reductase cytochrome b subunit
MDPASKSDAGDEPLVPSPGPPSWPVALWRSFVGRKALMAVTGLVLFAYVLAHMAGNLQAFAGPARLDRYAEQLRAFPALLWTVRAVLLVAFLAHVVAGVDLFAFRRRARPIPYREWQPTSSTPAARSMVASGVLVLGFVVYHLLDLTFGVTNPDFLAGQVFHNVMVSFGRAAAVAFYLAALVGLGFHLWHGLYSASQSLGVSSRVVSPGIRRAAAVIATLVTVGFAAVPLAVLFGVLG